MFVLPPIKVTEGCQISVEKGSHGQVQFHGPRWDLSTAENYFWATWLSQGCCQSATQVSKISWKFQWNVLCEFYNSSFTPEQWEDYSNNNILKSEKEQNASATLRGVVTELLDQATQDILLQRQNVDRAFEKRIKEVQEAHDTLTNHLEKVPILIILHTQLQYAF